MFGTLVMIGTSAPPRWGEERQLHAELRSEGQGDDQLLRIHVHLTDGVAEDTSAVIVWLTGTLDRPASDLTLVWSAEDDESTDLLVPEPFSESDDFLTLYAKRGAWQGCRRISPCDLLFEARVTTQSSVGYTMALEIDVQIDGNQEHRPQGEIEASVEVPAAP